MDVDVVGDETDEEEETLNRMVQILLLLLLLLLSLLLLLLLLILPLLFTVQPATAAQLLHGCSESFFRLSLCVKASIGSNYFPCADLLT